MTRPARLSHGTYGYAHRFNCRCQPCDEAHRAYVKGLALDRYRGITRKVPAEPVRAHVNDLLAAGATRGQIFAAGKGKIARSQIRRLLGADFRTGNQIEFVHRGTAQAFMSITLADALRQERLVPAMGTHRRIHALQRLGHTPIDISQRLGLSASQIYQYLEVDNVTQGTAKRVGEVYDQMSMTPGTSERLRWKGIRLGHAPPLAWDEADIDDPDAEPDWSSVRCAAPRCHRGVEESGLCGPHLRHVRKRGGFDSANRFRKVVLTATIPGDRQGLLEEIADLRSQGLTPESAAARLGRGVEYVKTLWSAA